MSTDSNEPGAALDTLRSALEQLRALAALPHPDPRHARAAEQVAAIVADLERAPDETIGLPHPPSPG